eukprot:TRINITY_DN15254_c0_g1_i4.p2 TRINITY_DN15254_c0_g1~~TRINITY_DN15254_c0_g1_i4.p2  ORF type:complete len:143 (-),score=3.16 TRINITY_DN15254_c0_g1_i4:156-584(-)
MCIRDRYKVTPGVRENQSSSTVMAPSSHTSTQLSQPMHSSALTGTDFSFCISNTSTGHTSTHSSQPTHFASSTIGLKAIFQSLHKKQFNVKSIINNTIKSAYYNRQLIKSSLFIFPANKADGNASGFSLNHRGFKKITNPAA